jgi:hypothetical protein
MPSRVYRRLMPARLKAIRFAQCSSAARNPELGPKLLCLCLTKAAIDPDRHATQGRKTAGAALWSEEANAQSSLLGQIRGSFLNNRCERCARFKRLLACNGYVHSERRAIVRISV